MLLHLAFIMYQLVDPRLCNRTSKLAIDSSQKVAVCTSGVQKTFYNQQKVLWSDSLVSASCVCSHFHQGLIHDRNKPFEYLILDLLPAGGLHIDDLGPLH